MSDFICNPPVEKVLPVTRGCDRSFSIRRTDSDGVAVDFAADAQVYMWVDIDKAAPTQVFAVVSGSVAAFTISSEVADLVRSGTRFRIVLDLGSDEVPLLVGKFARYDG